VNATKMKLQQRLETWQGYDGQDYANEAFDIRFDWDIIHQHRDAMIEQTLRLLRNERTTAAEDIGKYRERMVKTAMSLKWQLGKWRKYAEKDRGAEEDDKIPFKVEYWAIVNKHRDGQIQRLQRLVAGQPGREPVRPRQPFQGSSASYKPDSSGKPSIQPVLVSARKVFGRIKLVIERQSVDGLGQRIQKWNGFVEENSQLRGAGNDYGSEYYDELLRLSREELERLTRRKELGVGCGDDAHDKPALSLGGGGRDDQTGGSGPGGPGGSAHDHPGPTVDSDTGLEDKPDDGPDQAGIPTSQDNAKQRRQSGEGHATRRRQAERGEIDVEQPKLGVQSRALWEQIERELLDAEQRRRNEEEYALQEQAEREKLDAEQQRRSEQRHALREQAEREKVEADAQLRRDREPLDARAAQLEGQWLADAPASTQSPHARYRYWLNHQIDAIADGGPLRLRLEDFCDAKMLKIVVRNQVAGSGSAQDSSSGKRQASSRDPNGNGLLSEGDAKPKDKPNGSGKPKGTNTGPQSGASTGSQQDPSNGQTYASVEDFHIATCLEEADHDHSGLVTRVDSTGANIVANWARYEQQFRNKAIAVEGLGRRAYWNERSRLASQEQTRLKGLEKRREEDRVAQAKREREMAEQEALALRRVEAAAAAQREIEDAERGAERARINGSNQRWAGLQRARADQEAIIFARADRVHALREGAAPLPTEPLSSRWIYWHDMIREDQLFEGEGLDFHRRLRERRLEKLVALGDEQRLANERRAAREQAQRDRSEAIAVHAERQTKAPGPQSASTRYGYWFSLVGSAENVSEDSRMVQNLLDGFCREEMRRVKDEQRNHRAAVRGQIEDRKRKRQEDEAALALSREQPRRFTRDTREFRDQYKDSLVEHANMLRKLRRRTNYPDRVLDEFHDYAPEAMLALRGRHPYDVKREKSRRKEKAPAVGPRSIAYKLTLIESGRPASPIRDHDIDYFEDELLSDAQRSDSDSWSWYETDADRFSETTIESPVSSSHRSSGNMVHHDNDLGNSGHAQLPRDSGLPPSSDFGPSDIEFEVSPPQVKSGKGGNKRGDGYAGIGQDGAGI
jgi:hypothetical protein